MRLRTIAIAALAGAATLSAPAAAAAKHGDDDHGRRHGGKPKVHTFVFKGHYAGEGAVTVTGGNSRVRRAGAVGTTVTFDLAKARIVGPDADGNGTVDVADLQDGARVVVQAKLPRGTALTEDGAVAARKLVVKRASSDDDDDAGEDRSAAADHEDGHVRGRDR